MEKVDKKEIISKFQRKEGDTGSTEVQIALLTAKIKYLTEHLKANNNDKHTRRGLLKMVGKRNGLLKYLESCDINKYRELKKQLEIR